MQYLTKPRHTFFETFGYLHLPGLLDDRIDPIIDAFEQIWQEHGGGNQGKPHDGSARSCIIPFIDQSETLAALLDDPRIEGLAASLAGDDFNYTGSDGNLYATDGTWHSDGFRKSEALRCFKIALYLDPVTRRTGALRVIPGSHRVDDSFALALQELIGDCGNTWGVDPDNVPAVALETRPGDVVVFDQNIKHVGLGGGPRRRMFTINVCEHCGPQRRKELEAIVRSHVDFWAIHRERFDIDAQRPYGRAMVDTAGPRRRVHLEQLLAFETFQQELLAEKMRALAD